MGNQGLMATFDKQALRQSIDLSRKLADNVAINVAYEPSEALNGRSFYEIVQDFDCWLKSHGYCLYWPDNALCSSGDDLFPAVIAPSANFERINTLLNALGNHRCFSKTQFL
jgi:hypothetical protein